MTNFETVIAIDPTADKSRALAVASAVEIGELTKAQQLHTNYALKDSRWERWAAGKMVLASNAVLGTKEFATLAKNFPTFVGSGFISEGNHILRQVDWKLYSTLMQASTNTISTNKNTAK